MKIIGIIIGLVSGGITGSIVGLFSGHLMKDLMISGNIAGVVALVFFKNEILETNQLFDNPASKIIMSNSWVFWVGNFLAAIITTAVERLDYSWGGFISCGLSIIIAMIVTVVVSAIVGKGKLNF